MAVLKRDDVLQADDIKIELVPVPGVGRGRLRQRHDGRRT